MNFRQVHLDFHTSEKIMGIGEQFDKKQFQEALKIGHVNSITVFSKCHHGYAYHPSDANEMHPGLKFDLLKAQIEAAHEIGVKTPVYLSAGYDERLLNRHPEWRVQPKEDRFDNFATPKFHWICLNTPYLDHLLAQIKEAAERYDGDGIFLDIVGVRPCYCEWCKKSMQEAGLDSEREEDVLENAERVYANYLRRVRETIDSVKPGLPVFHNSGHIRHGRRDLAYANSHLELESLPTGGWGYDHFPMSARYAQNLNREYLGMTGKFHTMWGEFGGYKHANALRYEMSLSVAMGAKCSIGDQLAPNGKMDKTTYELIGAAYKEVEEKEEWLDHVRPVCDVAVLTMESAQNDFGEGHEGRDLQKSDVGVGRILLEGKYLFSMIDKDVDLKQFKVLILPDGIRMKPETLEKVQAFVKNGGKILATGTSGIGESGFLFDFGAIYEGLSEYKPSYARPLMNNPNETDYIMYTDCQKVQVSEGTELVQMIRPYFNRTAEHFCSHQHSPSSGEYGGAGAVAGKDGVYIAWKIFEDYAVKGELIAKQIVCAALDYLLGEEKTLRTDLGSAGVINLLKQEEMSRYIAHMIYAVPVKRGANIEAIEEIYPVYDTKLQIRVPEKVKRVYLAPQKEVVAFSEQDGAVFVDVPKIDCHQMIIFEV